MFLSLSPSPHLPQPYDTLEEVIGLREAREASDTPPEEDTQQPAADSQWARGLLGTLKEFQIGYGAVDLRDDGGFDLEAIDRALDEDEEAREIRMLHVQRSCGYSSRRSIPIEEIKRLVDHIRER